MTGSCFLNDRIPLQYSDCVTHLESVVLSTEYGIARVNESECYVQYVPNIWD